MVGLGPAQRGSDGSNWHEILHLTRVTSRCALPGSPSRPSSAT